MENEVNVSTNVKNWIIVIGVAVLTFIIVFFLTYKLLNGNKKKQQPSTTEVTVTYSAYKSGDSVTLTDNSKWHVLYDSEKDISYISLFLDPLSIIPSTKGPTIVYFDVFNLYIFNISSS